jgi:hypothetical protein
MNKFKKTESPTAKSKDSCTPSFFNTICKTEVINYVQNGYERWHNYAVYHNQNNGEKATDVLNEVIFDVLQKSEAKLYQLLLTTAEKYTEFDMLVLRTIKNRSLNKSKN